MHQNIYISHFPTPLDHWQQRCHQHCSHQDQRCRPLSLPHEASTCILCSTGHPPQQADNPSEQRGLGTTLHLLKTSWRRPRPCGSGRPVSTATLERRGRETGCDPADSLFQFSCADPLIIKQLPPKMKLSFIFKFALYLDRYSGTGASSSRFVLLQELSQDCSSHALLGLGLELCSPSRR